MKEPGSSSKKQLSLQLFYAVHAGDTVMAQKLIDGGADVNHSYDTLECLGVPCLIAAIRNRDCEMAELLLRNGADPEQGDEKNDTSLGNAVFTGEVEIVKILLEYEAAINNRSGMSGDTPLVHAIREEQEAVFHYLLSRGADANATGYDSKNAFDMARQYDLPMPPELIEKPKLNWFGKIKQGVKNLV